MKTVYLIILAIFLASVVQLSSQTISGKVYETKQVSPSSRSHVVSKDENLSVKGKLAGVEFKLVYGYDRSTDERPKDYWECPGKTDEEGNFIIKPTTKLKEGVKYSIFGKKAGYISLFFSFKYEKKLHLDSLQVVMVPLLKR